MKNNFNKYCNKSVRVRIGVIIIKDNCILLIRHKRSERTYWLIPGGGLDFGETIEEAATRELKEETNLDIELGKLLFISETIYPKGNKHIVNFFYMGTNVSGDLLLGNESNLMELAYVPFSELNNYEIHPPINQHLITAYEKNFDIPVKMLGPLWRE